MGRVKINPVILEQPFKTKSFTIEKVLNSIESHELVLPSIQRDYVWDIEDNKIGKLLDSILQGYPIGTIIGWEAKGQEKYKWTKHEFISEYNKSILQGKKVTNSPEKVVYIIDGQQRLTSLNIAFYGKYVIVKGKNKKQIDKYLYYNLLSGTNDSDPIEDNENYGLKNEFIFHEDMGEKILVKEGKSEKKLWIKCKEIFESENEKELVSTYKKLVTNKISKDRVEYNLNNFLTKINRDKLITINLLQYIKDQEKILNVFVRVNDGGVTLEKSDLLLSFMEFIGNSMKDKNGKAMPSFKRELKDTVSFIKNLGYNIKVDLLLKGLLFISDKNKDVKYSLKIFTKENVETLIHLWYESKQGIIKVFEFLQNVNFKDNDIVSKNSLIPLMHVFNLNSELSKESFLQDDITKDSIEKQRLIVKYICLTNLFGYYSGASDQTLNNLKKNVFNEKNKKIDYLQKLHGYVFSELKSDINKDKLIDIYDNESSYLSRHSHILLYIIWSDKPNYLKDKSQDHIFSQDFLGKQKITSTQINSISNIQPLKTPVNSSKNNSDVEDWLKKLDKSKKKDLLIPEIKSYDISTFEEFLEKRRELMLEKLFTFFNL